jgi:hypothetical protein
MTKHILIAGIALTAAACAGAPGATIREPVELFAGLRSYESPTETRTRLPGAEWTIRHLGPAASVDNRPRYEMQVAELQWRECGQDGTLILSFVNDRLYRTAFVPINLDACLKDLTTRGILTRSPSRDDRRRIDRGELEGRPFVVATDTRLDAEIAAWLARYS